MSIYSKERTKITIGTVLISLGIIAGFWALLFVTDFIMFNLNMPMLFSKTTIQDKQDKYITIETGLGYYVITQDNVSEFYLFENKIKWG